MSDRVISSRETDDEYIILERDKTPLIIYLDNEGRAHVLYMMCRDCIDKTIAEFVEVMLPGLRDDRCIMVDCPKHVCSGNHGHD